MKIAIIGAGFAGLASAWFLKEKYPESEVTILDKTGIGAGASGVAAGLLHAYAGSRSKLNWKGQEAYLESKNLLDKSSEILGMPTYKKRGLLRPILTEEQHIHFREAAETFSDIRWLESTECQEWAPGVADAPGIFIASALTVDPLLYMKGLWMLCESKGVQFEKRCLASLQELDAYTFIIIALGADTQLLPELSHLPLTRIKGQILEFAWPEGVPLPRTAVNSQVYLLPDPITNTCLVGSTFERHFSDAGPDIERAMALLHPKLCAMYPAFAHAQPLRCMTGVRASAPQHMPYVKAITPRCWVFSGLGSKGLLYHALIAKTLCASIS